MKRNYSPARLYELVRPGPPSCVVATAVETKQREAAPAHTGMSAHTLASEWVVPASVRLGNALLFRTL